MNLVEKEWIDISLAMKVTNGFTVFLVVPFPPSNREKQINNVSFWFPFNFPFSFPAADLFAYMHFPLCY